MQLDVSVVTAPFLTYSGIDDLIDWEPVCMVVVLLRVDISTGETVDTQMVCWLEGIELEAVVGLCAAGTDSDADTLSRIGKILGGFDS